MVIIDLLIDVLVKLAHEKHLGSDERPGKFTTTSARCTW